MGDITLKNIFDAILGNLGTLVVLLVILYGGYKRWWVFGWYAQELKNRNERLENRIDNVSGAAQTVASIADKTATVAAKNVEVTSE